MVAEAQKLRDGDGPDKAWERLKLLSDLVLRVDKIVNPADDDPFFG